MINKRPEIPIGISYWDSGEARKLFDPNDDKTVEECLMRRISKLLKAIKKWTLQDVVTAPNSDEVYDIEPLDKFSQ